MKGKDIEEGKVYLAYAGSLAPVKVMEKGVPFAYPGQIAERAQGVRVLALTDIPLASDWYAARQENRDPAIAHPRGAEFVIGPRDVDRLADRDIVPDAIRT